jgi:Lon protease-like protein
VSERLPVFPLGTVLFPGLVLPLHIFEPRYRRLVDDLLALPEGAARRFGVLALREGHEVGVGGARALYSVGCIAQVRQVSRHEDGRFDLVTVGAARFRVDLLHRPPPTETDAYIQADATVLPDRAGDDAGAAAVAAARTFARYQAALVELRGEPVVSGDLPTDPLLLSYLVAAAVVVPFADRQRFLEAPDAASRLRLADLIMRRELEAIAVLPSLPATDISAAGWSAN